MVPMCSWRTIKPNRSTIHIVLLSRAFAQWLVWQNNLPKVRVPISRAQVLHLRNRLWSQMKLHAYSHKPNASCLMHPMLHLISSHFIHIGSSIFLCSLAICPSLSFIGYLKPSNQDNLPHSIIETIQYRYPPSPRRAYSIYKCLQEQPVVSSNRREEYKKWWWNCYSYTGSYNEINNLDYL